MKVLNTDQVMSQLHALAARAKALENVAGEVPGAAEAKRASFGDLLGHSLGQVNETIQSAEVKSAAFIREDPGASLVDTMVAVNKAQVSFRMAVEVRNRLIQAYQDIASMPM